MNIPCLSAKNLSVSFGDKAILSDASFELFEGDVVLLEGNNGTGKTTLLRTILGFSDVGAKCTGEVKVCGSNNVLSMKENDLAVMRSNVGYLEQKDAYDMYHGITVMDVLADSLEASKNARLDHSDRQFIIDTFNKFNPENSSISLKSKVNKLSGGQQRLVSIIAALCLRKDSEVFIIDEPLNNLDISAIVHISNILNTLRLENPKALMIIVSHCKIFPFISKVATIKNGVIEVSDKGIVCNACFGLPDSNGYY